MLSGVYETMDRGLDAFADDVAAACSLWGAGCKRQGSEFAAAAVDSHCAKIVEKTQFKLDTHIGR